jgi:hypothetical protein
MDFKKYVDMYLKCFFKGFLKHFEYPVPEVLEPGSPDEKDLMDLFLGFCKI